MVASICLNLEQKMPPDQFQLHTDASGTLDYSAYWAGLWLSQEWPQDLINQQAN
jgi:hypothetical protein